MFVRCLLAFLFTGLSVLQAQTDTDWPRWRGAAMDAHSQSTGLLQDWNKKEPELLWQSEGFGEGVASISIAAGKIFTLGNFSDGQAVVAANQSDGKIIWKQPLTESPPRHQREGSRSTPTYDLGKLYVVSSDGQIVCLDAENGKIIWQKSFKEEFKGRMMSGWGYSESPLVDGDLVLCTPGGSGAGIVALNKETGDVIWRSEIPDFGKQNAHGTELKEGAGYSSIVISQGAGVKQYVQLLGQGLVGIRAKDGKFLWGVSAAANPTANISTPIVEGDYVFYSTAYGAGAELVKLAADGEQVKAEQVYFLKPNVLQNHHGGMVLVGGHIYCGHKQNEGMPICIELATGEVKWGGDFRGEGKGSAAVLYADGNFIFRYQDGTVALIEANPDKYVLKGKFKPAYQEKESWAHPVVVGKKLYLREQDHLMCYDLSSK
jgi:outer membrane protein assembly factor BamB